MKKFLALILAVAMMFALVACGEKAPAADDGAADAEVTFADLEEMTLVYSSTKNDKADAAQLAYLEAITAATEGKVKWDVYLSNSLITNTRDIPEGIATGIADVATLNINNYTGAFPLNYNILSIPFTGITDDCRLDIMNYMYDKYPELEQEFTDNGLKLIGWSLTNSNNLGVKLGKEYTGIADLKNVDITGSSGDEAEILAAAGAVPVTVAFPEIY